MSAFCPQMSENRPPEYREESLDMRDKSLENREGDCANPLGSYENVILSAEQLQKLKQSYPYHWENMIERLSEYMASSGKKYKNYLATMEKWAREDNHKTSRNKDYSVKEGETV